MKKYRCIKSFEVEKCDDNGFTIENVFMKVRENSIWDVNDDGGFRMVGGELRLENKKYGWLEISKERFEEYFEEVE